MRKVAFIQDCPLGLGWAMGHVSLKDAVIALANETGSTVRQVRRKYQIKEEDMKAQEPG